MKKRFIISIISVCLAFAISVTGFIFVLIKVFETNAKERTLKAEQEKTYITQLFHDQGADYMNPLEPDKGEKLTLKLRTKRYNVTRAQIQYTYDKGVTWKSADMKYDGKDASGNFDMWKGKIVADSDLLQYRFIVSNKDSYNTVYYDNKNFDISEGDVSSCWQVVPGHKTPDWAKGALWYSLLPDAFYNGNTTNDKQTSGNNTYVSWNKLRSGLSDKYGGDLKGIEEKLDYIESLNVDAIYINPIQKTYQNAGYGTVRYDEVDSSFGNINDLTNLSNAIHKRGLKFAGDVILTFTPNNSYYFNEDNYWPVQGAYQTKNSQWKNLFKFFNYPDNYMRAWSSPAIDLNNDVAKDLFYANKNSYLNKYESLFDGYRFDCGGWLWGSSDTDDIKTLTFIKEIRKSLKSNNKDFFMFAEADWPNMNTSSWDASWNINYMPKLQDYAKGLINETLILEAMNDFEKTLPRNVALCMINMMCDHDSTRVVQPDDYMYNAAALIQMTYLGSPSVFYGEEINRVDEGEEGIGTTQSFYSMEWEQSNWDQSRLAFYRSCAELRKEFPCIKNGVVKILNSDINNNTLSFARWDKNDAAITITSQNEDTVDVEISASEASLKDGTVLTDWFTGESYEVNNGVVKAHVIPGGTVLVTGKKSANSRGEFTNNKIGRVSKRNAAKQNDTYSFTVEGKGKITGKKDVLDFYSSKAYNGFSLSANISGKKSAAIIIRDNLNQDSLSYSAVRNGDSISIVARKNVGEKPQTLAKIKCDNNTYIKLVRDCDNQFTAYYATVSEGVLSEYKEISKSKVKLSMGSNVYYGFSSIKGQMRINNIDFSSSNSRQLFDKFDNNTYSAFFNEYPNSVKVSKGKLTLSQNGKNKETFLLANDFNSDWTFKSKLSYTAEKDSYGGLVSKQDNNNYIIVGRKLINNKKVLFIGKYTNGKLDVYDYVNDTQNGKDIILQIQKVGSYYSGVYSNDNGKTWHYIGRIFANYSSESVGLMISGNKQLKADYVSFGDSINDGDSTNTPYSPIDIGASYLNRQTEEEAQYEFINGDWSLTDEGWHQNDSSSFGIAAAVNQKYNDFYAEATLSVNGKGWSGLGFGLSDYSKKNKSGFYIKCYKNGKLELVKDDKVLSKTTVLPEKDGSVRLVVQTLGKNIKIYAGQNPCIALNVNNDEYNGGYVCFCSDKSKCDIKNFHIGYTSANWVWTSGSGTGSGKTLVTQNTLIDSRQIHSVASLAGYGFTDFALSVKLLNAPATDEGDAVAGILLSAGEGKSASANGVLIGINREKQIFLSVNGSVKSTYQLRSDQCVADLLIIKQNGKYSVYCRNAKEPVLTYSENINRGGAISIYSYNAQGSFSNLAIENLQKSDKASECKITTHWNTEPCEKLSDTFSNENSKENYRAYNEFAADFNIKNGKLICENSSSWEGGITVFDNIYRNFTMKFKLNVTSSQGGWMSIGLRKNNPFGNHNNSGVSAMITATGSMFFFDSEKQKEFSSNTFADFKTNDWYDVEIVAKDKNITLYVNGKKMSSYTDTDYNEGFISFTSGMTNFEIDDLIIIPT